MPSIATILKKLSVLLFDRGQMLIVKRYSLIHIGLNFSGVSYMVDQGPWRLLKFSYQKMRILLDSGTHFKDRQEDRTLSILSETENASREKFWNRLK